MHAFEPFPIGQSPARPSQAGRGQTELKLLDWTNLDAPPTSSLDVAKLATLGGNRRARVAVVVNTPRMLRAATTFSEHAGTQGVEVRVFIDSAEALAWLYKEPTRRATIA